MADLGSIAAIITDINAKVTTNGANQNTGARVNQNLRNIVETLDPLKQDARAELDFVNFRGTPYEVNAATTTNLGTANSDLININGNTTITAFSSISAGATRKIIFNGRPLLVDSDALQLGGYDIQTASGDTAIFAELGSGNWIMLSYRKANVVKTCRLLVTQTGTNIPTATVLENDVSAFTFSYEDEAVYRIIFDTDALPQDKTFFTSAIRSSTVTDTGVTWIDNGDSNTLQLNTAGDDALLFTPLEILVYT